MFKAMLACTSMFLLWLAAPVPFAVAATYCVAPRGDDSRAGTESQPWKTLRKAAAAVQPGDTVRIKAGDYFVGPTWIVNRAGTAESPITYRAFGDGEVRITGSSLLPPEKWTRVKGGIYSTPIDQPVMAVFRNAYPLPSPGDRAKIFTLPDPPAGLLFKGGTSLSKVFGVIERFSEDVDLSFDRAGLGFGGERDPRNAPTGKQRKRGLESPAATCRQVIRERLFLQLMAVFGHALGEPASTTWGLELAENDPDGQKLMFRYPAGVWSRHPDELAYIRPVVRLEFGARSDHWP